MIRDIDELEDELSKPSPAAIQAMAKLSGDLLILGVGGKMGPTLARMAKRASDAAGVSRRVIGVSRFSDPVTAQRLESHGVEIIRCDLLQPGELRALPDVPNVVFMTGMKFGATGQPARTWAMNVLLPAQVAEQYRNSRIVAFSTGNVYGLTPVAHGGSVETDVLQPVGEYAMTTLGRERMLEHSAQVNGTSIAILRLNYACELRYGVLVDVARKVFEGQVIDVSMGQFNAIWQADANSIALECLHHTSNPPFVLNIAGSEILSVRQLANEFGRMFGCEAKVAGVEASEAFLSNSQRCVRMFGYPRVGVRQMMEWIVEWIRNGGATLGKPTHFENSAGEY